MSNNAQATLTVDQFRPMNSLVTPSYTAETTALAPHADVTLVTPKGIPTFRVKRPVSVEISLASADPTESYRPLGLFFRQKTNPSTTVPDPDGLINFTQSVTSKGTVVFHHSCTLTGDNGNYEFFVLIQRVSDGVLGLIDPDIETETGE